MAILTKLVRQVEREEQSIIHTQTRTQERESVSLLAKAVGELKTTVENYMALEKTTATKLGSIASALAGLGLNVPSSFSISHPIEIKKPAWWENFSWTELLISLQSVLDNISSRIFRSKLEIGSPETRQYNVVVDEEGRPIDWQKLINQLLLINRPLGVSRGFTTMRGGFNIVDDEVPTGTIDDLNQTFTLANAPNPTGSLKLFLNGARQRAGGEDFSLSGRTITFTQAPLEGSVILADYRWS